MSPVTLTLGAIDGENGRGNPISGLSGEGDFNGLQLVSVPEPTTISLLAIGGSALLGRRRRRTA